jgi:hypothetical protein
VSLLLVAIHIQNSNHAHTSEEFSSTPISISPPGTHCNTFFDQFPNFIAPAPIQAGIASVADQEISPHSTINVPGVHVSAINPAQALDRLDPALQIDSAHIFQRLGLKSFDENDNSIL